MIENPSPYKIFNAALNAGSLKIDSEKIALFRLSSARYHFTQNFECASQGLAENTVRGYSESLRLFLAHTALEILIQAIDFPKKSNAALFRKAKIENEPELAKDLRRILDNQPKGKEKLISKIKPFLHKSTANALQDFADEKNDNVTIVAHVFRIMVAHGYFTATGMQTSTKKNAETFHKLSDSLLKKHQAVFREWLEKNLPNEV